jgi:hypothetical protein
LVRHGHNENCLTVLNARTHTHTHTHTHCSNGCKFVEIFYSFEDVKGRRAGYSVWFGGATNSIVNNDKWSDKKTINFLCIAKQMSEWELEIWMHCFSSDSSCIRETALHAPL